MLSHVMLCYFVLWLCYVMFCYICMHEGIHVCMCLCNVCVCTYAYTCTWKWIYHATMPHCPGHPSAHLPVDLRSLYVVPEDSLHFSGGVIYCGFRQP